MIQLHYSYYNVKYVFPTMLVWQSRETLFLKNPVSPCDNTFKAVLNQDTLYQQIFAV